MTALVVQMSINTTEEIFKNTVIIIIAILFSPFYNFQRTGKNRQHLLKKAYPHGLKRNYGNFLNEK